MNTALAMVVMVGTLTFGYVIFSCRMNARNERQERKKREERPLASPLPFVGYREYPDAQGGFMIWEMDHGWLAYRATGMAFIPKPEFCCPKATGLEG
jgi:hypothetical protein